MDGRIKSSTVIGWSKMAVHMIRVVCEPPKGDADSAVDDWVTNYSEWTGDPVEHSLSETNTKLDGSGTQYVIGQWRFEDQGEGSTEILDDLSSKLQSLQSGLWHNLAYHVCCHDESEPGNCSWNESVSYGSIPSDVPTVEVS